MRRNYKNIFFGIGIIVLILMVIQLDFTQVWAGVRHAGYWFVAVVLLWAFLYVFNTTSWWLIIHSTLHRSSTPTPHSSSPRLSPFWLYKVTVAGFALNYATPGGLMGGEPYRIMMLSPKIGTERASSSVILYVMTHIFSHFWFWLLSIPLFFIIHQPTTVTILIAVAMATFCTTAIWFFMKGYKRGLAVRGMDLLIHIPYIKKWAIPFINDHKQQLDRIDKQIAALHNQNPRTFWSAVGLELLCRICSAAEIMFILLVLMPCVNYIDCILIISFTTLIANMLFFMPLQLGGREGGFLMSITGLGLGLTPEAALNAAIFVALLVRVRELIWTAIGLMLIKTK